MKTYLSTKLKAKGADASKVLNRAIETAKEKTTLSIPDGTFYLYDTVRAFNKGIRLEGSEDTNFRVMHRNAAFLFERNGATARTYVSRINLLNSLNVNNSPDQHGFQVHVPTTIEDVIIENFHGDGLHLTGDVASKAASDVSFCKVMSVTVRSCKGNGIYIAGGDSNASFFAHCDVRDNEGYGIWDNSFLGNGFFGCMAHMNAKGNYHASDGNNRSTFLACYSEDGSPQSVMGGEAMVFGGMWSGGVKVNGNAIVMWNGKGPNK